MRLTISLVFMFAIPVISFSATIEVPKDYPTIQQAIDAAVKGDTVLVAPGTYNENIDFKGKSITVTSSGGADLTFIDGTQAGSVVTFKSGEGPDSVLFGFTITNGLNYSGGGIRCNDSSPTIENNTISKNAASGSGGGGVCCYGAGSYPTISNNTIEGNAVDQSTGQGGGILCDFYSSPVISNNTISGNWVTEPLLGTGQGGGIACYKQTSPTIEGNTITGNAAGNNGGGICCQEDTLTIIRNNTITGNYTSNPSFGHGGGIFCFVSSPRIENNTIAGNSVISYGGGIFCMEASSPKIIGNTIKGNSVTDTDGDGGGIYCAGVLWGPSSPTILGNRISDNSAGGDGGGICLDDKSLAPIGNNMITGNVAGGRGGGIFCEFNSSPDITNNTIHGNTAGKNGGGIHCRSGSCPTITNTILWDNDAPVGPEMGIGTRSFPSHVTISHSDVDGGQVSVHVDLYCSLTKGANMIDDDPLFFDAAGDDFHLTWGSPCINRGTDHAAPAIDIDGDLRPVMGTVDMGADEFEGLHRLAADVFTVSEMGGTVNFFVTGGIENAGRKYFLLGSLSGTVPGQPLPDGNSTLRINWDIYTDFIWNLLNSPVFHNFWVNLDASGQNTAQLNVPPLTPGFVDVKMYYAFCLGKPWEFVSNPVTVVIVP